MGLTWTKWPIASKTKPRSLSLKKSVPPSKAQLSSVANNDSAKAANAGVISRTNREKRYAARDRTDACGCMMPPWPIMKCNTGPSWVFSNMKYLSYRTNVSKLNLTTA